MIVSITKIELNSYWKFPAFFNFNGKIINELKASPCKAYKISFSWNLKTWYTMTLWENEEELQSFYRSGTHLIAMKQSSTFSNKLFFRRVNSHALLNWKEGKRLFQNT